MAIIFVFAFGIITSGLVSAETYKQNQLSNLTMDCLISGVPQPSATATISIQKVGGDVYVDNVAMTHVSNGKFVYQTTFTDLGDYELTGTCNAGSLNWTGTSSVNVSPSGTSGSSNLGFFFLVVAIIYAVAFIGFFGKNEWVAILGGMGMIALGIYSVNNGVVIYKDFITNVFSWTTIGVGAFFAIYTGVSLFQDN